MLIRLLVIAAILFLVFRLVRYLLGNTGRARPEVVHRGTMVVCEQCGVYLPEADAVRLGEKKYSCRKH